MNWLRRHRPSPTAAIALAALVVALGGVAFAAIPDSNGTIHACYQTTNGSLRVVESSADCRSRERALDWNQQGPPATGRQIIARARSTTPVTSISLPPYETAGAASIPMTGTTSWTQGQNEIDAVYGEVALSAPDQCPLVGYPTVQSFAEVRIKVDGVLVAGVGAFGGSGSSQTLALNSGYVFEPGASTGRTLIAEVNDYCEGDHHFTIKSLKVDVVAIH